MPAPNPTLRAPSGPRPLLRGAFVPLVLRGAFVPLATARVAVLAWVVGLGLGCGAPSALVVRTGAIELDCPDEDVAATLLTHDVYEVTGCGGTAVVRCPSREECEVVPSGTAAPVPRVVEDRPDSP